MSGVVLRKAAPASPSADPPKPPVGGAPPPGPPRSSPPRTPTSPPSRRPPATAPKPRRRPAGTKPEWLILDYGVGNLHSLQKALEACGARTRVTQDAAELADADIAVLPGVGAFGHVMARVAPGADGLRNRHAAGRPTFGVCIGHQVLHESSAESPGVAGLGILPGAVRKLPASAGKVPHMGWNGIDPLPEPGGAPDPVLLGVEPGSHVYYVHSFAAPPSPWSAATTTYGTEFAAVERDGATVGVQFHPEKSGDVGLRILKNLVALLEPLA